MAHPAPVLNGPESPDPGTRSLKRAARLALDLVLPPQCLACGVLVDEPGTVCAACWSALRFLAPPWCAACGLPFEYDPGWGALCGPCVRQPPVFARARAALAYDDSSRRPILGFKHGDRTESAVAFARWMERAGAEVILDADLIVPVPLHWTRLFLRRYNQAGLLAQAVAARAGLPCVPDALKRVRRTPPLGRLGPAERRRTLGRAFAVAPGRAGEIAGRRVLLIDDVLTTGETATACARVLLAAGANAVDVLTLARVVRPLPG